MAQSRLGPDAKTASNLGPRQLECADERYHMMLAAVQRKYKIANKASGPRKLHQVSFEEYTELALDTVEADRDPRRGMPQYIDGLHKMFQSNAKTLEGGILYMIAEPQCWAFIDYYHSPAGTTGRDDWDSMFATLRTNPRRSVIPCMFASTPFDCHIQNCPFLHPPQSDIAAARASLVEARRVYLTTPTERNRYTFLRHACNGLESRPKPEFSAEIKDAVKHISTTLEAICDNGLCAKGQAPGEEKLMKCSGCGWARYCSRDCQKRCWKRHKSVCIKADLLIQDDNMWTMEGWLIGQPTLHEELSFGLFGKTS